MAVLSLFAEGTLVQLWLEWPFLPHLKQIGAGRLFSPDLPTPPVVDPDAIPGRLPFFDVFGGGCILAVGGVPYFPFPAPFAFDLALPYRG